VVDLSDEGARVEDVPSLSVGTRGTVQVVGVGATLPFAVRNQYDDALGLVFGRGGATVAAIRSTLERLTSQQAA
jgi:hypothetical protein